jgi:hypothetical protein
MSLKTEGNQKTTAIHDSAGRLAQRLNQLSALLAVIDSRADGMAIGDDSEQQRDEAEVTGWLIQLARQLATESAEHCESLVIATRGVLGGGP